ncbi:MAG: PilC/PilY family type IV pilus protein [Pseudomonadota bacterium]|nr:PilC/PilY family type IV pilus protein [Pseudomonadota bacterium]
MNDTVRRFGAAGLATLLYVIGAAMPAAAQSPVKLADQPIFGTADVPGNLALTLSVEFPTAISVANLGNYADSSTYLGYFDPVKCYTYVAVASAGNPSDYSGSFFQPASFGTGTYFHTCSGQWSGNFMNWASMQTIDPFRWALSGGYRSVDTVSQTILEKAYGSTQGSASGNFKPRGTLQGTPNNLPSSLASSVTPFNSWDDFDLGVWGNGTAMVFSEGNGYTSGVSAAVDLTDVAAANKQKNKNIDTAYRVYIRVDVCDATTALGLSGLESNCVQYPVYPAVGPYHYKPEGLLQQYSNKIRYSALGYLNGLGSSRQGGVLREPMGFIGPTYPQPLSSTVITNTRSEWDAVSGIMFSNPDPTLAASSGVAQSGVLNYLNQFGHSTQKYETYDNVSELYYAAVRYYETVDATANSPAKFGNVPEWTNSATTTELDGFPVVTTWADPIAYWCQKNFILGIGDNHTWYDYNVGGGTASGGRAKPPAVASDSFNQAAAWTTALQTLEGIALTPWWPFDSGATYYMAGLAYGVHVNDIRPDLTGAQTISTFWMDVEEGGGPENLNDFYLASKYGGFTPATAIPAAPATTPYNMSTPLSLSQWDTSGASIVMNGKRTHPLPDNYFLAGNANLMVAGLASAFTSISNASKAFETSFSFSSPVIATSGELSFSSQYDSSTWTDTLTANLLTFAADGTPIDSPVWSSNTTVPAQLAGTGWQTARNIATWNASAKVPAGVPFEVASLSSSQLAALLPSYSSGPSPITAETNYLNYLRGDQTNEVGSTASGSTQSLRKRTGLLGDVINASLTAVAAPIMTYGEGTNPGYSAFKTTYANRTTMVYAGANDGMLHAFVGPSGLERFAYVPSALFQGPNGTPQVDGLAQIGNPNYVHHYYVDSTPKAFDVDLNRTNGNTTGTPNWATVLIGGLGKGGKSYYAIDVTDPDSMTSESVVAGKVLWEFSDSTMGYSYGFPSVFKTAQYGWVVALTSGYDNSDGYGYLYLVDPATGALLQKIKTPILSSGLTWATGYIPDGTDYTAESVYAADLNGQLWRFDLRAATGSYPTPTQIASLTDASGNAQPVTTPPRIEIHPITRRRYIMLGTGKLLSNVDVSSSAMQTFYSIIDGTTLVFQTPSTPITRANLTQILDVTAPPTLPPQSKGWYYDLGTGWRVATGYPQTFNGNVVFSALSASTDACSPSGSSQVYGINYATGNSVLTATATSTVIVPYVFFSSAVTNLSFVSGSGSGGSGSGSVEMLAGVTTNNHPSKISGGWSNGIKTRLLNWRDIPTAE